LVGASFGRSFYVLDDYSPLRDIDTEVLESDVHLFQPRDAYWYRERTTVGWSKGSQGASFFTAPNPAFGATFTYYLKESLKSKNAERKAEEKKMTKEDKPITFPGWDVLEEERLQDKPAIMLMIRDEDGNLIRKVDASTKKGVHRTTWDLRYSSVNAIRLKSSDYEPRGYMVTPGTYYATLVKRVDGQTEQLTGPVPVVVKPLIENPALERASFEEMEAYRLEVEQLSKSYSAASIALNNSIDRIKAMENAIKRTPNAPASLDTAIYLIKRKLFALDLELNGNKSRREVGEKIDPTIRHWLRVAMGGLSGTYGPTPMQRQNLQYAQSEFALFKPKLEVIRSEKIPALEKVLMEAGAPWIEGQPIPEN
jgi:hypothetical protein